MQDHFEYRLVPPRSNEPEITHCTHGRIVIRVRVADRCEKLTTAVTHPVACWRRKDKVGVGSAHGSIVVPTPGIAHLDYVAVGDCANPSTLGASRGIARQQNT